MKTETLEEAAKKYATEKYGIGYHPDVEKGFINGVNWYKENFTKEENKPLYSEKEMKALIIKFWEQFPDQWDIETWIDENLKK